MADERPSIEDILAQARSQDSGSGSPTETPPPSDEPAAPAEETAEAEETSDAAETPEPTPKKAPEKAPSSTADILSMARGQDGADSGDEPAAETPAPAEEKPAQPKKPAAKPSGVSDILAMARSQDSSSTAGDPEPATSDNAAASDPDEEPAEKVPATADDADRPSVQEMLQQLRQTDGKGGATQTQTVAEQPEVPEVSEVPVSERPMPTRPAAPDAPVAAPAEVGRRGVLIALLLLPTQLITTPFAVAWTALAAACGAMVLGLARFMFPNTLVEPPMTFKIGPPSDYPPESVSTKFKADRAVWIVRSTMYNGQDQIVAVSTVCTHLGCTPNWLEGEQKFKCPCHGSGFYKSGVNFEGPAPRPLERHGLSLAPDGMLEVDKSKKFQEELGQWEEDGCFVTA